MQFSSNLTPSELKSNIATDFTYTMSAPKSVASFSSEGKSAVPSSISSASPDVANVPGGAPSSSNGKSSMPLPVAPTDYWQPTCWNELTLEYLEAISSFLTLGGLVRVATCSRTFHALARDDSQPRTPKRTPSYAVVSAPGGCSLTVKSRDAILNLIASPLRRHVKQLIVPTEFSLTHAELHLIKTHLPLLTVLDCTLDFVNEATQAQPRQFPNVRKLTFEAAFPKNSKHANGTERWGQIEKCLADIGRITTLEALEIKLLSDTKNVLFNNGQIAPATTFGPLVALSSTLRSLKITLLPDNVKNRENLWLKPNIDAFRSLSKLKSLDLGGKFSVQELEWLTEGAAQPQPFQQQQPIYPSYEGQSSSAVGGPREEKGKSSMPLPATEYSGRNQQYLESLNLSNTHITDAVVPALSRFTGLRTFEPTTELKLTDLSFLAHMQQLESVKLICGDSISADSVVNALAPCTRIHSLTLSHKKLTEGDMTRILTPLVNLRALTLENMQGLTKLSFASSVAHLPYRLETLVLTQCKSLPSSELHHLRSLTLLRHLVFEASFKDGLDQFTINCFNPKEPGFLKVYFPYLTQMEYITKQKK